MYNNERRVRLTCKVDVSNAHTGPREKSHRTIRNLARMTQVEIMQMPAKPTDTFHCPISEESAFRKYQIANFWCMGDDPCHCLIGDEWASCEIQHAQVLKDPTDD